MHAAPRRLSLGLLSVAAVLAAGRTSALVAQNHSETALAVHPLFAVDQVLDVRLVTDVEKAVKDHKKEGWDQDATLGYLGPNGDSVEIDLKISSTMQQSSRKPAIRGPISQYLIRDEPCKFPTLHLTFDEKDARGTVFEGQEKLDLLTHCRDNVAEYEQHAVQEYLVYRTYSLLTDLSLRARLVRVTYVDKDGGTMTKYGALIEDEQAMAARNGGEILDMQGVHPLDLDAEAMITLALFQYMVMNTDWGVSGLHRISLAVVEGQGYPIPHQFKWSGMVNAEFARPDPSLKIRYVRDRLYRGFCRVESEFVMPIQTFNDTRDAIYALHRNETALDPERLEQTTADLDKFYAIVNDEQRFQKEVLADCREDTR